MSGTKCPGNAVAIIGISCRVPGARNKEEFWRNLKDERDVGHLFTDEELLCSGVSAEEFRSPDYVRRGLILDDIDLFDAGFFGFSPKEAQITDCQQRLFLESAWEVFEDAGYDPHSYDGVTGVFASSRMSTYLLHLNVDVCKFASPSGFQTLIGNDKDYLSSRVSYKLGLTGPTVVVQSACSSSLVAVHLAVESLLSGSCDMAMAGGVAIAVPQEIGYLRKEGMIFSSDGYCRAFDSRADGMLGGNGLGIVLLKRLEDALEDKDNIYAVIRGSAVNNDGADKIGFTAPSSKGQSAVIGEALEISGVAPSEVGYIECHGTGTILGDPIEVEALSRIFSKAGEHNCAIGSVKTNVGHLDVAAGVCGLIKTALMLKHRYIVPSLHFEEANPKMRIETTPFFVNTQSQDWESSELRRAGVSSFGIGGTNAHIVLEEAPDCIRRTLPEEQCLLVLSARSESALRRQVDEFCLFLEKTDERLEDICFTTQVGRKHFSCRLAVVAKTKSEMKEALADVLKNESIFAHDTGAFFLYSGKIKEDLDCSVRFSLQAQDNQDIAYPLVSEALCSHYELVPTDLVSLAKLHVLGAVIEWDALHEEGVLHRVSLPTYPFERQRYWFDGKEDPAGKRLFENYLHTFSWRKQVNPVAGEKPEGQYLILCNDKSYGQKLDNCLSDAGISCSVVSVDEKVKLPVIKEQLEVCQGVVYLFSDKSDGNVVQDWEKSFLELSAVVELLNSKKGGVPPRLILVTRSGQSVIGDESVNPLHMALWGYGRFVGFEYPELRCLRIDLTADEEDFSLIANVLEADGEHQIAFRRGEKYVMRLVQSSIGSSSAKSSFGKDASYLITGGLGAIGMESASWLVERGARSIVLLSRNPPSARVRSKIDALEEKAVVTVVHGDVTDEQQMKQVFEQIRVTLPPLRGIIHGAGVLDPGEGNSEEIFKKVASPKLVGAWNLHQLSKEIPLDFFVCFSSSASMLSIGGAAHFIAPYSIGNGFLDGLAYYRKSLGLPASSISWGPWSEIGFMAQHNMTNRLEEQGMKSVSPEIGKYFFDNILSSDLVHCGVLQGDWKKISERIPSAAERMVLAELVSVEGDVARDQKREEGHGKENETIFSELSELDDTFRQTRLLEWLREHIARVLKMDPENIGEDDNLMQLGLDSLVFLELTSVFEKQLQTKISLGEFVSNPYLARLVELVLPGFSVPEASKEDSRVDFSLQKDVRGRYKPFELTDIQHAYWIGRSGVNDLGDVACHIYFEIHTKDFDLERYQNAWRKVIARHDMLRAIILPEGQQVVLENVPKFTIQEKDLRESSGANVKEFLSCIRHEMSHQVKQADCWPLFEIRSSRLGMDEYILHISIDIIIADGYSIYTLMKEVDRLYHDPLLSLPPLECTFRDYVKSELAFRETKSYSDAFSYWRDKFDSFPDAPELPLACAPSDLEQTRFARREFRLPPETWKKLQKTSSKYGITRSNVLLCAFAEIIGLWSKSQRFCLNLTFFQRIQNHAHVNEIVGDFTSLILLDVLLKHDENFVDRAILLQKQLWQDMEYRHFSGVRVLQELSKLRGETVTMPVIFTSNLGYESLSTDTDGLSLPGELTYSISQTPQVWIDNQVSEDKDGLLVFWDAVEDLFPKRLLDDMFWAYCHLIECLAHDEDAWSKQQFDLLPKEQVLLRKEVNSAVDSISEETLDSLFLQQVERSPDQVALITEKLSMSYGDVWKRAMGVTNVLLSFGIHKGDLVGVVLEKGWEQVVAVLGVLGVSAAYVPVSPDVPSERLQAICSDASISLILTSTSLDSRIVWPQNTTRYCIDTILPSESLEIRPDHHATDLAYLIYTSGSTGTPKGVMIEHQGAVNTVVDINKRFNVCAKDRVLAISDLNFDLSVYDIFGILAAGGAIVIPDEDRKRDPEYWAELISRHGVSIWNTVPAFMDIFMEYLEDMHVPQVEKLRLALLSGDWIPLNLPQRVHKFWHNLEFVSLGGATEASIWSIIYPVERVEDSWISIPYGKALTNQKFYVLNENLESCPDFVSGDLFIGGIGLARGYWNDEEKNRKSFITHPLSGERLYRTGDLGRMLPDGNIEFLGRNDLQVKVNGFRIELGEIESVLGQHSKIDKSVVTVHKEGKHRYLVAYIVGGEELTAEGLEKWLASKLPNYEVPSLYVFLDSFPLTANGKVDRKQLPEVSFAKQDKEHLLPETETERKVLAVWSSVLETEDIGCEDNFFRCGGDSLLATRALLKINSVCNTALPLAKFFEFSTVRGQSIFIDRMEREKDVLDEATDIEFLLKESDSLLEGFAFDEVQEGTDFQLPKKVFLTGCTGFLGSFLLKDLLEKTDSQVYCLVRAKTNALAKERILNTLQRCSINIESSWEERIFGVAGELSVNRFGLSDSDWMKFCTEINFILHCAADTNFSASYSNLKEINVGGTIEILRLASSGRIKSLHYVATTSVFHVFDDSESFRVMENDDLPCRGRLYGGYPQSKWVAEKIVRSFKDRGYPVSIYRPGFITGDSTTGFANDKDFVARIILGCFQLGRVPNVDLQLDLLPVDFVSSAIVTLALQAENVGYIYHLTNPDPISSQEVITWVKEMDLPLVEVSYQEWIQDLHKVSQQDTSNPLYPLLPILPLRLSGQKSFVFDSSLAQEVLGRQGVEFPLQTKELFVKYVCHFKK